MSSQKLALKYPNDNYPNDLPAGLVRLIQQSLQMMRPPTRRTISQWADDHRFLSPEASAEPRRWLTARAEYQRGIMDAVGDLGVERVVVMKAAQVGWRA